MTSRPQRAGELIALPVGRVPSHFYFDMREAKLNKIGGLTDKVVCLEGKLRKTEGVNFIENGYKGKPVFLADFDTKA